LPPYRRQRGAQNLAAAGGQAIETGPRGHSGGPVPRSGPWPGPGRHLAHLARRARAATWPPGPPAHLARARRARARPGPPPGHLARRALL